MKLAAQMPARRQRVNVIKYGTPGKGNRQIVVFGRPVITSEAIVTQPGITFALGATGVATGEFEI